MKTVAKRVVGTASKLTSFAAPVQAGSPFVAGVAAEQSAVKLDTGLVVLKRRSRITGE
jgi:hypothetical protein